MLLTDGVIKKLVFSGHLVIEPFMSRIVKEGLSYGLGGNSLDVRLSSEPLRILLNSDEPLDPKNFDIERDTYPLPCLPDGKDLYFIMPPRSYGLGVTVEYFEFPSDICAVCLGKSTYARSAQIANTTPIDAGFKGHITLEFLNPLDRPVKVYALEGIAQFLFLRGEPAEFPYDSSRKYQGQEMTPVGSRVL